MKEDYLILKSIKLPFCFSDFKEEDFSLICWDIFLKKVYKEGVAGLIFYNLKDTRFKLFLPKKVFKALEDYYLTNLGRNLLIHQQLQEIFKAFGEERVFCFLIRGGFFSKYLYHDLGIRPMADIDLAIFKKDLSRVKKILEELGYQPSRRYPFFFFKESFYIDLHLDRPGFWRVDSWPSKIEITREDVFKRSHALENFPNVRVFEIYDMILSCCQHIQQHSFSRLIWFVDIVWLMKGVDNFCWDSFLERAEEFNLLKTTYFVIKYLEENKLISLSRDILIKMENRIKLNFLERRNLKYLLSYRRDKVCGELLFLFSLRSWLHRLKLLKEVIFLKKEFFPLADRDPNVFSYFTRSLRIGRYLLKKLI